MEQLEEKRVNELIDFKMGAYFDSFYAEFGVFEPFNEGYA